MNCTDYQNRILDFIDGQSAADNFNDVFFHLPVCAECREFFQTAAKVNSAVSIQKESYPASLDIKIAANIPVNSKPLFAGVLTYRIPAYFAAALLLIMIFAGLTAMKELNYYRSSLERTSIQLDEQIHKTELLFHSLAPVEVTPVKQNYYY